MRPDAVENGGVAVEDEGEAIAPADATFPDVSALRVLLTFHLLCPQGPMPRVRHKKAEGFFCTPFQRLREPLEVSFKLSVRMTFMTAGLR